MSHAWSAELTVSADLALALIERQFPQLAPARVELLGAGWDNTAFRVNDAFVFRFPRRQVAVPWLECETRLLPTIAARLPLPVPNPVFVGRPAEAYPWPFSGYPMVPGRTACGAALDDEQRTAAAVPLARFLAALHGIPAAEAALHGAGPDTIARLDVGRRVARARDQLAQLAGQGIVDDVRRFTAILDAAPVE
jgi:aminoglycoside phosphotransferase (APT) family kinase protein